MDELHTTQWGASLEQQHSSTTRRGRADVLVARTPSVCAGQLGACGVRVAVFEVAWL
jgi:hypothetical protein